MREFYGRNVACKGRLTVIYILKTPRSISRLQGLWYMIFVPGFTAGFYISLFQNYSRIPKRTFDPTEVGIHV